MVVRAAVVIDYQNIHLTAHNRFCANGAPKHECLIHPLHFATQLLLARRAAQSLQNMPQADAELAAVRAYRGLPGNRQQPDFYRRNLAQQSEWTRDRRVQVDYRPLKYTYGADGAWVSAQEKGVDVRVALEVARLVLSKNFDVVILAAHDTDQEPTLEFALDSDEVTDGSVSIETAGWHAQKQLRVPNKWMWHTVMGSQCFERSIDRKVYH